MKHNILWGIILLVASLSFTAKAQKAVQGQFSVKGVLLDSLSNEGEPYSTIRISLKNNPAKPVKLAVTGADGRFDERLAVPDLSHSFYFCRKVSCTEGVLDIGKS